MVNYPLNFTAHHLFGPIEVNITELNETQVTVTKTGRAKGIGEDFVIQDIELKTDVENWLENAPEAFAEV